MSPMGYVRELEESLELLQRGGQAWTDAEKAKIAESNWRIVAEKPMLESDLCLALDCNALPKSDVALDVGGRFFSLRIEPRGVLVAFAVDDDVVVAGGALPGTDAAVLAGFEELFGDGGRWEVDVPLDQFELV